MIVLNPIGYVHNACTETQAPESIKKEISEIEILPEYAAGLQDIEQNQYLDMVFSLHRERRTELVTRIRSGKVTGIFASRSPLRPNHLGITTVKLLDRRGNTLHVQGADALDGSPVVDLKHCDTSFFEQRHIHDSIRALSPRADIIRNILANDTRELLLKAAQIHGHICPGLALGVMGATQIMQQLLKAGEDVREYTLTVEMQNCPVDGVLFVTGCTPGTRRFVWGKPDNHCFYLRNKANKGWKITFKHSNQAYIKQQIPENLSPTARGLATLHLDPDRLFEWEEI